MLTGIPNIFQWLDSSPHVQFAFQPLIALSSGCTIGFELLTRPETPQGEALSAEDFFHQASVQGMAVEVDRLILRHISQFLQDHKPRSPLFVNLHPDSLSDPDIQSQVNALRPGAVVLEITERGNWTGSVVEPAVEQFRHRGGAIALDDFGTGYSGLEKLVAVRPNYVKLDRSIIAQCHLFPVKRNLIASLSHMARYLRFQIIAEGIETRDELNACIDLGVEIGQGYYFSRPQSWAQGNPTPRSVIQDIQRRQADLLASQPYAAEASDPFRTHWSLMMEHLATAPLNARDRVSTVMSTAFKMLHPTAMTLLARQGPVFHPLVSFGHVLAQPVPWDSQTWVGRVFEEGHALVIQKSSDTPLLVKGPIWTSLNYPESIAIFPIGNPTWGVMGIDFMPPYYWTEGRLQIIRGMTHLITLMTPQHP